MKSALVLAAALAASGGCYKTTYMMQPSNIGTPSPTAGEHWHWSLLNIIELSSPVNLQEACPNAAPASIEESVTFLGGLINAVLGTYVPILSVHNASVYCGPPGMMPPPGAMPAPAAMPPPGAMPPPAGG